MHVRAIAFQHGTLGTGFPFDCADHVLEAAVRLERPARVEIILAHPEARWPLQWLHLLHAGTEHGEARPRQEGARIPGSARRHVQVPQAPWAWSFVLAAVSVLHWLVNTLVLVVLALLLRIYTPQDGR